MILLCLLGSLIVGALIGSFLNVVIYRYNTGLSVAHGRSQCFVCGKKLAWYELIPIVSFIVQRGRCTGCKAKVSWQYPFVEIATAILFLAVVYRQVSLYSVFSQYENGLIYSFFLVVFYFMVTSILIVISVYDLRHKIIPDGLVYTFITISLIKLFIFTYLFATPLSLMDWLNLFSPLILSLPFALLWFVSKGMWIGFGDAKLAFGIGALLGLTSGLSAIIVAFWIGALCGISMMVISKFFPQFANGRIGLNSEIPFAPFLIAGIFIVLFTGIDVLGLSQLLNV